jgi:hypothetical protein
MWQQSRSYLRWWSIQRPVLQRCRLLRNEHPLRLWVVSILLSADPEHNANWLVNVVLGAATSYGVTDGLSRDADDVLNLKVNHTKP